MRCCDPHLLLLLRLLLLRLRLRLLFLDSAIQMVFVLLLRTIVPKL
jgi:hypothetical protein